MNFTIEIRKSIKDKYTCCVNGTCMIFDSMGEVRFYLRSLNRSLESASSSALSTFVSNEKVGEKFSPNAWISVKERLPDTGREVIVCDKNNETNIDSLNIQQEWIWHSSWDLNHIPITHWQSLPEAPKGE